MGKGRWLVTVALLLVGTVATLPALVARARAEGAMGQVDLVLDVPAYRLLADQEGVPLAEVLRAMASAGATAAAVSEDTLEDLQARGKAMVRLGRELRALLLAARDPAPAVRPLLARGLRDDALYVLAADRETADAVADALQVRLGQRVQRPTPLVLELDLPISQIPYVGLGLRVRDAAVAREAGLRPVPRPYNVPGAPPAFLANVFAEADGLAPDAGYWIPAGPTLLGYGIPGGTQAVAEGLRQRGLLLGLVEAPAALNYLSYPPLPGLRDLAERLDWRVARVLALPQDELDAHPPGAAVDKWVEGVLERNIRVLYLRPFLVQRDPGQNAIETNVAAVRQLASRLRALGYTLGPPQPMPTVAVAPWQRSQMAMGVAGALLAAGLMAWPNWPTRWFYLGAAAAAAPLAALPWLLPARAGLILALLAAVAFPLLAGTLVLDRWHLWLAVTAAGRPAAGWRAAALAVLLAWGVSLVGGLHVAAFLAENRYMLEFDYFRGVKVALVAPVAGVVALWCLGRRPVSSLWSAGAGLWRWARGWLRQPLTYGHVVAGLAAAAGLFLYLERSGNDPLVPAPAWEVNLRSQLAAWLVVRPRFKEFALGWPALWLAAHALARGQRALAVLLVMASLVACASVVNSFAHVRTPWLLSALRASHGLWLGMAAGVAVTAAAHLAAQAWAWARRGEGWGQSPAAPGASGDGGSG